MIQLLTVLNWLLPVLYLGVLADYAAVFFLRARVREVSKLLPLALGVHLVYLVALGVHLGRATPVGNYEVLSVVALATAGVYWLVELSTGDRRTGVFVLLAVLLLQYSSSVFVPVTDLQAAAASAEPGRRAWVHLLPAIVAYTAFTISAVYGLLYLLARRDLKRRRFGLLFDRLPSLELLGRMNWLALAVGFVSIVVGVATGAVMLSVGGGGRGGAASGINSKVLGKIVIGSAAVIVYAIAVAGRLLGRWGADRVAKVALAGFVAVAAILISSIVLS